MFKKKSLIALLLSFVFVLTACGSSSGDNKTLNVAVSADATSLDPNNYNDDFSENAMRQIYNTLVEKEPSGELRNALAKSIEQPDDLTYIVKLREDVKFSNGEDLTVEDVIFSLKRVAESSQYSYIFGNIDENSFVKQDENTLEFKLNKPDGSFLQALSHPGASILNQKHVEENKDDISQNPMGTGPFVLESWNKLDSMTLVANENYWGDKPEIEKMVLKVIPEASQRLIELESGSVDVAYKVSPNDVGNFDGQDSLKLYNKLDNSTHFVGLNVEKEPFNNKQAREAMSYALDMKSIVNSVYMGQAELATTAVNPNFKYSMAKEVEPIGYDIEKAKALLEEAGIDFGKTIKIYVNEDQQRLDVATMMQAQLKEVGINLEVVKLEWGAFIDALKNGEHDMFIMSWSPSVVDPHYELFQPFASENRGKGPNFMFYSNSELDSLLEEGIRLKDSPEREAIYKKAQEIVNEEKPWIYICYGKNLVGAQSYVENFDVAPTYTQELYRIKLNK